MNGTDQTPYTVISARALMILEGAAGAWALFAASDPNSRQVEEARREAREAFNQRGPRVRIENPQHKHEREKAAAKEARP